VTPRQLLRPLHPERLAARWWPSATETSTIFDESYQPLIGLDNWARERVCDPRVVEAFHTMSGHIHRRWLFEVREPVLVEPSLGRVFTRHWRLLEGTSPYEHMDPKLPLSALPALLRQRDVDRVSEAVSLHDTNGSNYWHLHDDVLPKAALAASMGYATGITSAATDRSLIAASGLSLVVQQRPLLVDRLLVGHTGSLRRENFPLAASRVDGSERVLLVRSPLRDRHLRNQSAVADALLPFGFAVLDTDYLPFEAQRLALSRAAVVVAVHGAGIVNYHLRACPACLIEIFPADHIAPHFAWMARTLGWDYTAVVGGRVAHGSFEMDPRVVVSALQRML